MLTPRAQGLAIILTMIALIGCIQKYDYNIVVGVGIIFLGSKHAFLHNLTSFYILIIFTILVDIVQIIVSPTDNIFMKYVITAFQIVVKIGILVILWIRAKRLPKANQNMGSGNYTQNDNVQFVRQY